MSERLYELQAARRLYTRQRGQGLAALNSLFRSGAVPGPLPDGRYRGKFVAVHIAPGLTQWAELLAGIWMPWLGKMFDSKRQYGDNILTRASYPLARIYSPFYRGFRHEDKDSYRAFAFRTYIAPGLMDTDRTVLKIDYNLKDNPALTVRRILDELVQLDTQFYLGKAHVHWWWGRWQTVAYFTLSK
jgi:hypothetical protein